MQRDCCFTGFRWSGTPSGRETKLQGLDVYVTGSNKERAILFVHDAVGWKFNNSRLLADHFAQEVGATVYLPDFFHGNPVEADKVSCVIEDGKAVLKFDPAFDIASWFAKNGVDAHLPEALACAKELRSKYGKVGVVGHCWGGSMGFKLASKEHSGLIDCVSIAHPGAPTEDDVKGLCVPVQIIAPEYDPTFTDEWKTYCNTEIPKLGIEYDYQFFPGMVHGFTTKCDDTVEKEKRALELAKNAVVYWFASHLG